jgi:integrase
MLALVLYLRRRDTGPAAAWWAEVERYASAAPGIVRELLRGSSASRNLGHDEHGHPAVTIERQHRNGKYKPRPKTTAGNRTIRIPAALSRRLTKRRAELGVAALSTSPLFATRNGTPYDRHNVARKLRAACDDAGVERISSHVLRHSIGSLLYEGGWTDVQIAAFLGHEDPAFTKRTYLHAVDGGDVSALSELFGLAEGE